MRLKWLLGALALAAAATAWGAAPAAAQETASVPPAVRERALQKLRLLERALRPDPDSVERAEESPDSGGVVASAATDSAAGHAAAGGSGVATARPLGPPASDSILAALLRLEGYTATEYTGTGARFGADSGRLELLGKAQVTRGRESLTADSLIMFSEQRNVMCGYGNPVLTGEGNPVRSEQVCYSLKEHQGEALRATTTFSQGANWIVHGDRVYTVESDRAYVHSAMFTDCDLEEPHYHFAAERVKLVNDDVLVARNVTLNFGDVPVFWLPFLVQSLKEGRRSGLLTPVFSVNDIVRTSDGYNRRIENVGFYWAINDHLGAEVALDWFSNNWTALHGLLQYSYVRQFLEGSVSVRRFWQADGGRELTLMSSNRWKPGERTSVRLDASYASSSDFVRRNSFDPLEQIRTIDSNGGIDHRMDWGSLTVGASRRQYLDDGKVQMTLPSVGLSINNVTLFGAPASEARWYNNATWTGSAQARISTLDVQDTIPNARDETMRSGSVRSTFTLGKFSWGQSFEVNEQIRHAKRDLDPTDTIPGLSREALARMTWSTDLRYQQRLIGTSTLEPGLSLRGELIRSDSTGQELLAGPTRLNFDTRLRTEIYGLWPGVGPFERIRHKLTPSVTYTYSPEPTVTDRQRAVFGVPNLREQNRIQIGLNQTFEAKYRESPEERAARDSAAAAAQARGSAGEPVELPQPRRITLLALSMSAIAYDFVKAREDGRGLESELVTTTVSSDLLRGLQLSFTTDLFRADSSRAGGRAFDMHLRDVNASFSLDHDWWLFRLLGLGPRERETAQPAAAEPAPDEPEATVGETGGPGLGLVGGRRSSPAPRGGGVPGTWSASISYSLARPRPGEAGGMPSTQFLRANFTLQPTEYWSLHWTTSYSITEGEFGDHYLSLRRDLHDWEASFDFVRGINGNFSFQFRVQLRANPDIKVDYDQRGQRPVTAR